jgi:hypothetical protein
VLSRAGTFRRRACGAPACVGWFFFPGWGVRGSPDLGQDWRLQAAFDDANGAGDIFERLRSHEQVLGSEVGGLLPSGTVLSRRDDVLFVYASTRSGIDGARRTIEQVARAVGHKRGYER